MNHSNLYIRNVSLENFFSFFNEFFVNLSWRGNGGIYFLKIGHMGINENPRLCCGVATSMTAESAHDFPAQRIFTIIRHIYNEHVTRRTICFSWSVKGVCSDVVNEGPRASHVTITTVPLIHVSSFPLALGGRKKRKKKRKKFSTELRRNFLLHPFFAGSCLHYDDDFNGERL